MRFDAKLRSVGFGVLAGLMLGASPMALMAETPKDVLVIAASLDDMVSLDPHEAYEFSGLDAVNNMYDGLVELDPVAGDEPVPGLAQSWVIDPDGKTYRFEMRQGVTFASGNPVRAEDAAFSLQRAVKLNKSAAFILNQFGWTAENVDQMVTVEGNTVVLRTDKAYAPSFVLNCLTAGVGGIVDKETVMSHAANGDMGNEWLKTNSAGTGAYILKSYKPNEGYALVARTGHWRGDAIMKTVLVRHVKEGATKRLLLEKHDIDIARELTPVDIEALAKDPKIKIQNDVGGQIYYLSFNQKNENYKNAKFLDAMRWAVDYQGIEQTILKGMAVGHQAFLPRGYLGALEDTPYKLDIEKAKALLAESGIKDPHVVFDIRNIPDRMEIAQSLQNTFGQAGIKVDLNIGEGADQLARYRARQHDATLQTWGPDYPDPHTNASAFAMNDNNSDDAGTSGLAYRNAYEPGALHQMTEAALMEMDTSKRKALYEEIQRKHRDTSPFIAMFQQNLQTAMAAEISGFYTGGALGSASYWLVKK